MEMYLRVGVILKPHGVHGECKVYPTTSEIDRFDDLENVYLKREDEEIGKLFKIQSVKYFKNQVILKFEGIETPEEIMKFQKYDIMIDRADGLELGENENYICDLIGLKAILEDGTEIGELTDVYQTGAKDVYIFKKKDGKELLLPAINECILNVDLSEGTITIRIMKGLE